MKIQTVAAARKDQGACESCGKPMPAGRGYKFIAPRYGPKRKRHTDCPTWRPSEMTSAKIATAYAGQESAEDALDGLDFATYIEAMGPDDTLAGAAESFVQDVMAALTDAATAAEECAADYQEGLDNMPAGLQESSDIPEKVDALEAWQSELQDWAPDAAEPDDADEAESWAEDVIESARTVIGNLEA